MKEYNTVKVPTILHGSSNKSGKLFVYAEFTVITVTAFLLGTLLCLFLGTRNISGATVIFSSHFISPFGDCRNLTDCIKMITYASLPDAAAVIIVTVAAFTSIFPTVCGALLLFKGIIVGYSASFVGMLVLRGAIDTHNAPALFITDFLMQCLTLATVIYAMSAIFEAKREKKRSKGVFAFDTIKIFAVLLGSAVLINSVRYLILHLISL